MKTYKLLGSEMRKPKLSHFTHLTSFMKTITSGLFWFINTVSCLLILVLLTGTVVWLVIGNEAKQVEKQLTQAQALVKEKVKFQATDVFSGCLHPANGVAIVSVNKEIFFGVKNNEVFIPRLTDWYNNQAKALAPALPIKEENINLYYLMEYCR